MIDTALGELITPGELAVAPVTPAQAESSVRRLTPEKLSQRLEAVQQPLPDIAKTEIPPEEIPVYEALRRTIPQKLQHALGALFEGKEAAQIPGVVIDHKRKTITFTQASSGRLAFLHGLPGYSMKDVGGGSDTKKHDDVVEAGVKALAGIDDVLIFPSDDINEKYNFIYLGDPDKLQPKLVELLSTTIPAELKRLNIAGPIENYVWASAGVHGDRGCRFRVIGDGDKIEVVQVPFLDKRALPGFIGAIEGAHKLEAAPSEQMAKKLPLFIDDPHISADQKELLPIGKKKTAIEVAWIDRPGSEHSPISTEPLLSNTTSVPLLPLEVVQHLKLNTYFANDELVRRAKEAGCASLLGKETVSIPLGEAMVSEYRVDDQGPDLPAQEKAASKATEQIVQGVDVSGLSRIHGLIMDESVLLQQGGQEREAEELIDGYHEFFQTWQDLYVSLSQHAGLQVGEHAGDGAKSILRKDLTSVTDPELLHILDVMMELSESFTALAEEARRGNLGEKLQKFAQHIDQKIPKEEKPIVKVALGHQTAELKLVPGQGEHFIVPMLRCQQEVGSDLDGAMERVKKFMYDQNLAVSSAVWVDNSIADRLAAPAMSMAVAQKGYALVDDEVSGAILIEVTGQLAEK